MAHQSASAKSQVLRSGNGAAPGLTVALDPPNKVFYISADARMPTITATCQIAGTPSAASEATSGAGASGISYEWNATLVLNPAGIPNSVGRTTRHPAIHAITTVPQFRLTFNAIRGGTLAVTVSTTVNGKRLSGRAIAEILGTDPTVAGMRAAGVPDLLMKLMKTESGLHQFRSGRTRAGYPLFSQDNLGGVGIGQITRPHPNDDQVWSWQANVRAALALFAEKEGEARTYLKNYPQSAAFTKLVADYNRNRVVRQNTPAAKPGTPANPSSQVAGSPANVFGPVRPLTVTLPAATEEMVENETIRRYNGEPAIKEYVAEVDPTGVLVVQVSADGASGTAQWHRVSTAERVAAYDAVGLEARKRGNPSYVDDVRNVVLQ